MRVLELLVLSISHNIYSSKEITCIVSLHQRLLQLVQVLVSIAKVTGAQPDRDFPHVPSAGNLEVVSRSAIEGEWRRAKDDSDGSELNRQSGVARR